MSGSAEPNQRSAIQSDNDQRVEQVEADRRHNEQIHRGDVRRMIAQKSAPPLARRTAPPDHIFGHARLRNLKSELEQFAVDARRAPKRVFGAHFPYKRAQL